MTIQKRPGDTAQTVVLVWIRMLHKLDVGLLQSLDSGHHHHHHHHHCDDDHLVRLIKAVIKETKVLTIIIIVVMMAILVTFVRSMVCW